MTALRQDSTHEVERLRSCINDLSSLLALPAMWSGSARSEIARTLVEALVGMLGLDFACLHLLKRSDEESNVEVRFAKDLSAALRDKIGDHLRASSFGERATASEEVSVDIDGEVYSVASRRLGLRGEIGSLTIGSRRTGFPTDIERMILSVASNQAFVSMQDAQNRENQKRHASELDEVIFRSTAELGEVNKALRTEVEHRKRQEEDLRAQEGNLRLILENIPAFLLVVNPSGTIDSANSQTLNYLGCTLDELRGWSNAEFIHPEELGPTIDVFTRSMQSGDGYEIEMRIRRHDGIYRWFNSRCIPLKNPAGKVERWYILLTDIDRRKRDVEELGEKESQLRSILGNIPGLIGVLSPTGRVEFVNQLYRDYCGLSLEQIQQWSTSDLIHPDDLPHAVAHAQLAFSTGVPFNKESRFKRTDGVYRWFSVLGHPLRDDTGEIVLWCFLHVDVDDRKRAQEELQKREQELVAMVESVPALLGVLSPRGEVVFLNKPILEFFGRTSDELDDWALNDTVHPDDLDRTIAAMTDALSTGHPYEIEQRLRRHDGVYRWIHSRGHPLTDPNGNIINWYFLLIDIDDRKQAEGDLRARERELKRSEAFIAEGQSLSQTGTFYWNTETNEIRFSDELHRLYEIDQGEPVTLELIGSRIHPDDRELLGQKIEAGLKGFGGLDYEIRMAPPSGNVRHLQTMARGYRSETGALEYIGAVRDITERRASEQALSKLRSELAHISRVTSLGALTASIAHEVNQPLAGILTNASTGLRMLSADPPNVSGALETARRTIRDANRASDVISRLRAMFARKEAANESVMLNEAAQEVIALSLTELQRSRLTVLTQFADELPAFQGDRVQLQQVILNLILNASDAMKSVVDRPRELTIQTRVEGDEYVCMTVSDSGIGIEGVDLNRIFEPFYTTKNSGMGIGLSVSRGIIERHRGRLWAEPNKEFGTSFSFVIPLQAEPVNQVERNNTI